MSDASDIVQRLRDASEYEGARGRITVAVLLLDAANTIELQRTIVANWEAAWAVQRGSVAAASGDDEPFVILPAEPNTPR